MTARRSFSNDKAAVGEARRFVSEVLEDGLPATLVDTAILLTSEVVSNAVLHARSAPTVAVRLASDRVRVEVDDSSPALPVRKHYGIEATTGRGLMLLETLADRWGAERVGSGKRVWFDLDPAAAPPATATEPAVALVDGAPFDLDAIAASFGEVAGSGEGPSARVTTTPPARSSRRGGPGRRPADLRRRTGDHRTRPQGRSEATG